MYAVDAHRTMPQSVLPNDVREGRTSSRDSGVRASVTAYLTSQRVQAASPCIQAAIGPVHTLGRRRVVTWYSSVADGVSRIKRRSCSHSNSWQMKPGLGEIVGRWDRALWYALSKVQSSAHMTYAMPSAPDRLTPCANDASVPTRSRSANNVCPSYL